MRRALLDRGWDIEDLRQVRLISSPAGSGVAFVLSSRHGSLCILVPTSPEGDPEEDRDEVREFARDERIPFVLLSSGDEHWLWQVSKARKAKMIRLDQLPSPDELIRFRDTYARTGKSQISDGQWAIRLGAVALASASVIALLGFGLPRVLGTEEVCGDIYKEAAYRSPVAPPGTGVDDALRDSKIAFASNRDGNWEIYTMNADGSGETRLTHTQDVNEDNAAWSPNGSTIAFSVHSHETNRSDVYVMNADGSDRRRVTPGDGLHWYPTWSPDGSRLAFASTQEGSFEIFTINLDGTDMRNVTQPGGNSDLMPRWSPDGGLLAFTTFPGSGRRDLTGIAITNPEGTSVRRLSMTDRMEIEPAWSPDGAQIAFVRVESGRRSICVMNRDGSDWQAVTFGRSNSFQPTWSPDGSRIAFTTDYTGTWQIFMMDADGQNRVRVTDTGSYEKMPSWSPR